MSRMPPKWMIASVVAIGLGCTATAMLETGTVPSTGISARSVREALNGADERRGIVVQERLGRSCDGVVAAHADTVLDSTDPILRNVQSPNERSVAPYPVDMRQAGISGHVIASFVVDTLGVVPRGGAWIQEETRTSFGDAVCAHVLAARFSPLVVGGKRTSVRVVNWPTTFEVRQ